MMIAKVRTHDKMIDVYVDIDSVARRFSADPDVIRMWISDECMNKNGFDLECDDEILNLDEIVNAVNAYSLKLHPTV